jgi:hypothetical protein
VHDAVAAAGGATWGWLKWTENRSLTVEPGANGGVTIGFGGRY